MKRTQPPRRRRRKPVLARAPRRERYVLKLYVTGMTERSARAIASIRELCEKHLEGHYSLQVVDIYQHPQLTREEQIVAAPTLIKQLPLPLRRMVGDLSDRERVLFGLDLREALR
jgi:circadian clock protein KaiB